MARRVRVRTVMSSSWPKFTAASRGFGGVGVGGEEGVEALEAEDLSARAAGFNQAVGEQSPAIALAHGNVTVRCTSGLESTPRGKARRGVRGGSDSGRDRGARHGHRGAASVRRQAHGEAGGELPAPVCRAGC